MSYLNQNSPMHASAVTTMDVTMMTTGRVAINFPHLQEREQTMCCRLPVEYYLYDNYTEIIMKPTDMHENMWARLRDSRPGACLIHAT